VTVVIAQEEDRWMSDTPAHPVQPLRGVRQPGESSLAVFACNDYLWLGSHRSFAKLLKAWLSSPPQTLLIGEPATLNTLKQWSRRFDWQAQFRLAGTVSTGRHERCFMID
jgi:hypothetical protein